MHATHAHADPACAKNGLIRSKNADRHHNRLHYRATVAQVCELLAAADLTATSYRVALDTLARMLRRGSTTEAVGNEWVASRLHVGRNAVSTAYSALEACGFLRRVPVKHRGAPTRTRLISVSASLVDGSIPAGVVQAVADAAAVEAPGLRTILALVTEQGKPVQLTPMDRVGPDSRNGAAVAVNDGAPVVEPQLADACAEPGASVADSGPEPAPASDPFVFNAAVNASMVAKVPSDDRLKASQARSPKDCPVKEEWNLTPDEIRHYLVLIPKPERMPKRPAKDLCGNVRIPIVPDAKLVEALTYAHPRLLAITGSNEAAAKLGDQIAFQICRGLGDGNTMVGMRAGISLVAKGRWTEPREFAWFTTEWQGMTARALMMASLGL